MTTSQALAALGSLSQGTRLEVFRLLVQRGPGGLSAGAIAGELEVPASSLSFHLHQLMHAGLVTQERRSRQLIYAASYERMNALVGYLTENCCAGTGCGVPEAVGCAPAARSTPRIRAGGRGR